MLRFVIIRNPFLAIKGDQHPPECHENNWLKSSAFKPGSGVSMGRNIQLVHFGVKQVGQYQVKQVGQFPVKRMGQFQLKQVGQFRLKWVGQYGVLLSEPCESRGSSTVLREV